MTGPVHLILDELPHSGAWNMAVDAALLDESLCTGMTFVRLYRWDEATLSLGYFQKPEERLSDPRLADLPCVRRLSGGGAILHHHEQTYSCTLPLNHPLADQPYQLYHLMHSIVIDWLHERGVDATPRGQDSASQYSDGRIEPFLCFQRKAAPDLVVQGHKVLGSAQRRRRGAVLQHGSLLLSASESAPELLGVSELVASFEWTDNLAAELGHRMARALGVVTLSELPDSVLSAGRRGEKELSAW